MDESEAARYLDGIEMPTGREYRCRCQLPYRAVVRDEGRAGWEIAWDHCRGMAEPESPVCAQCADTHWNADGTPHGEYRLVAEPATELAE